MNAFTGEMTSHRESHTLKTIGIRIITALEGNHRYAKGKKLKQSSWDWN
jgi:hypothetical protein